MIATLTGFIFGLLGGAICGLVLAASALTVWDRSTRRPKGWASRDIWGRP